MVCQNARAWAAWRKKSKVISTTMAPAKAICAGPRSRTETTRSVTKTAVTASQTGWSLMPPDTVTLYTNVSR